MVPQSSSEFQTQIQPQRPAPLSNDSQRRALTGRWQKNKKQTMNILPNSVAGEEGNCSGIFHEANGDFKTVTEFNGCDRRKLRMDQQHCSYSTILN